MFELDYRKEIKSDLKSFQVKIKETDLFILADKDLTLQATQSLRRLRAELEEYILTDPGFAKTFVPCQVDPSAPAIVVDMAKAAMSVGVGPMAAVAGAIAERVGVDLLNYSAEVIVENGGDIFIKATKPRKVGIYAGRSPLSQRLGLKIEPAETPLGVCTSSGTVGHSVSFGKADAVVVVAPSTSLADAAATFIGNSIKTEADIQRGIDLASQIPGIKGILIIKDERIGIWGDLSVVKIA